LSCAATVAITSAKLLEKLPYFRLREGADLPLVARVADSGKTSVPEVSTSGAARVSDPGYSPPRWRSALLIVLFVFFLGLFVRMVFPGLFNLPVNPETATQSDC
jgi:hypothetical protein